MRSGTAIHLRRYLAMPGPWVAYFAILAGAGAVAMTIITAASEHYVEAAVAGVCALALFGLAMAAFRLAPRIAGTHTREIESRRNHAVYRARYPL